MRRSRRTPPVRLPDTLKQVVNLRSVWALLCLLLGTVPPLHSGEVGSATYMSSELTGRLTASGDPFFPWFHTGASWQHFGREVLVTNTDNGRSVRVLINDKGPAERVMATGVVIDLSKAAYDRIATPRDRLRGRMRVLVQPLPLETEVSLYPSKSRVKLTVR